MAARSPSFTSPDGQIPARSLQHVGRVGAGEDRVGEEPVGRAVDPPGDVDVGCPVGRRERGSEVQGDPEAGGRVGLPQGLHRPAVGQQQVVRCGDGAGRVGLAGGVDAGGVAQERGAPRLVEGRPGAHPVTEVLVHGNGVVDEALGGVAVLPAARQRGRQVPVVQREPGCHVVGEQFVDEARVVSPCPWRSPHRRCPARAATTPRTGRCSCPGRQAASRPRDTGGRSRRQGSHLRRWRSPPAPGRTRPRSSPPCRPRRRHPRSGRRKWRNRRGSPLRSRCPCGVLFSGV